MNIFVLDTDIDKCARYHCDKHLVKMITEHNQILGSIAYTANGIMKKKDICPSFVKQWFVDFPRRHEDGSSNPYGIGYANHPCTKWAAESASNYEWLASLNLAMCKEYTARYRRRHAGESITEWYHSNMPTLKKVGMTPFAQAMPDDVKNSNAVVAYRNYYKKYKNDIAKWAHSEKPDWWRSSV